MGLLQFFHDLPVKYRLLVSYSTVFVIAATLGSITFYTFVRRSIEANIESELSNYTSVTLNMLKTSVTLSIKDYLRAVAEKNKNIAEYFHRESVEGRLSDSEAKKRCAEIILSQKIGKTGYIVCVGGNGHFVVHPIKELENSDLAGHAFSRELVSRKEGYLEYDWGNPNETTPRPKALYMTYFQPWDWIISPSSYRDELNMLVNTDDFRSIILSLRCGATGYSFVIDGKGKIVIHPKLGEEKFLDPSSLYSQELVQEIGSRKTGKIVYSWKNPGESAARKKVVIFDYIPELDWVVASSAYVDEFDASLIIVRNAILLTVAMALVLFLPITSRISSSITSPLQELMQRFASGAAGDLSGRVTTRSGDEFGTLAGYFNAFMERLENYHQSLEAEIQERKQAEQAALASEEIFSKAFRSSPNGICIVSLEDRQFVDVNESLLNTTGYSREELIGKHISSLNLFPNRGEGRRLMHRIRRLGHLRNQGIEFLTKDEDVRIGVVSAEFMELRGRPAMLVTIEDVTDARRMEREIMDVVDGERRRIGQDLHDDLCPHLIGIEVLSQVLTKKLSAKNQEEAVSAERIKNLIREAIDKTRGFARGLCPVHLITGGLEEALKDLAAKMEELFGITCTFECAYPVRINDHIAATHLFYIAQEAAHNAIRHGKAKQVVIELSSDDNRINLRIRDDGEGMPDKPNGTGMGLQIMSYRAKLIGSSLEIESDPDMGTTVMCSLRSYEKKTPEEGLGTRGGRYAERR